MNKEKPAWKQRAVLTEAIARINESLSYPYSLAFDKTGEMVVYNKGTNMGSAGGGGDVQDTEFYTLPAEALYTLVRAAAKSPDKAEVLTKGFWDIDYEDWPYGREDGTSIHADHEPVNVRLTLEIKDGKSIFEAGLIHDTPLPQPTGIKTAEAPPKNEFMHKPGDFFIATGEVHILSSVSHGFTPADSECEEYVARCGVESQSWSMPSQGVGWAEFVPSLEDVDARGAKKCMKCFEAKNDVPEEHALMTDTGELMYKGILYTEVTQQGVTFWKRKPEPEASLGDGEKGEAKKSPEDRLVEKLPFQYRGSAINYDLKRFLPDEARFYFRNEGSDAGGDSDIDVDYVAVPFSLPIMLVRAAMTSPSHEAQMSVKGEHRIHKEAWHHASDYHTGGPETSEPVGIRVHLLITDDEPHLSINFEPFQQEKNGEGDSNPGPEILAYGRKVLEIVEEERRKTKYKYPGNVYEWLGDPAIPDFGDLDDPNTPCKLAINEYYTPDTSTDGDFNETGKDILYFDKKMAIEALSKVEPGKTITVKGRGRAVHFKEKGGWSYNRNKDDQKEDVDNEVEVLLKIYLTHAADMVMFEFSSRSLNPADPFAISRDVNVPDFIPKRPIFYRKSSSQ